MNDENWTLREEELLLPKVDFLFAQIFGSEEGIDLLRSLISVILQIPEDELKELKVLNPKLGKDYTDDRSGVLDIKAEVNNQQINIEMQIVPHKAMSERILFYWAKVFTEPFESSMKFHELKRTVSIIICDEDFLPMQRYHSRFHIWEDDERYKFSDAFEVHVLEIQKALSSVNNERERIADPLLRWLWYLSNNDGEVCEMLMEQNAVMKKAVDMQARYSKTKEARAAYTRRLVAIGDENTRLHFAREDGLTLGKAEGLSTAAKKMFEIGLPFDTISKSTGFSVEEVKKIVGQ